MSWLMGVIHYPHRTHCGTSSVTNTAGGDCVINEQEHLLPLLHTAPCVLLPPNRSGEEWRYHHGSSSSSTPGTLNAFSLFSLRSEQKSATVKTVL